MRLYAGCLDHENYEIKKRKSLPVREKACSAVLDKENCFDGENCGAKSDDFY